MVFRFKKVSLINNDKTKLIARRRLLQKKETMVSKIVPINQLKDWKFDKKIFHKSKQFFSVEGVKVNKARREVGKWDQLIFNQPHGGVLAFIVRETKKYGVEFLLCLRSEPGDANIKFCPSFSATKSNMQKIINECNLRKEKMFREERMWRERQQKMIEYMRERQLQNSKRRFYGMRF